MNRMDKLIDIGRMNMIKRFTAIVFGSLFLGIGINGFILPNHLVEGGMIGLGLIFKYMWNVHVGLTIIVLSTPIYILSWFYHRPFFFNGINGLLFSSFIIDLMEPLKTWFHISLFLSAILGGCFIGIGTGLMLKHGASTGGLDLLAQFISSKISINVGILIYVFDGTIILLSSEIVPFRAVLYSTITITFVAIMTTLLNTHYPKKIIYLKP